MIRLDFLDNSITNSLLEEQAKNTRKDELHGKLSGSILGNPLQAQILHIIGVPTKDFGSFELRKFQRGHHVEEWLLTQMPGIVETQVDLGYRSATGHIDALVDMATWDMPELGAIPHEIKSTNNAAWNWMFGAKSRFNKTEKGPKYAHKLQAGMYALALGAKHFVVHYVASDDYRIESFLCETQEISGEIDRIIDEVEHQLRLGTVPAFSPREDWQGKDENRAYLQYPTWRDYTQAECMEKLRVEYPEAYTKLVALSAKEVKE